MSKKKKKKGKKKPKAGGPAQTQPEDYPNLAAQAADDARAARIRAARAAINHAARPLEPPASHRERTIMVACAMEDAAEQEQLAADKGASPESRAELAGWRKGAQPQEVFREVAAATGGAVERGDQGAPRVPKPKHLHEAEWFMKMLDVENGIKEFKIKGRSGPWTVEAERLLMEAESMPHDREREASRLTALGTVHAQKTEVEEAVKCFTETMQIAKDLRDEEPGIAGAKAEAAADLETGCNSAMDELRNKLLLSKQDGQVHRAGVEGVMGGMMSWMLDRLRTGNDPDRGKLGRTLHPEETQALVRIDALFAQEKLQEKDRSGLHQLFANGDYHHLGKVINRLLWDKEDLIDEEVSVKTGAEPEPEPEPSNFVSNEVLKKRLPHQVEEAQEQAACREAYRATLKGLKLGELKARGRELGLDQAGIEYAMDESADPIAGVVDYLVTHAPEKAWSPFRAALSAPGQPPTPQTHEDEAARWTPEAVERKEAAQGLDGKERKRRAAEDAAIEEAFSIVKCAKTEHSKCAYSKCAYSWLQEYAHATITVRNRAVSDFPSGGLKTLGERYTDTRGNVVNVDSLHMSHRGTAKGDFTAIEKLAQERATMRRPDTVRLSI